MSLFWKGNYIVKWTSALKCLCTHTELSKGAAMKEKVNADVPADREGYKVLIEKDGIKVEVFSREYNEKFCHRAAEQIELLLTGKHPNQQNFIVTRKNKFATVTPFRPAGGPNQCFGLVKIGNYQGKTQSTHRIIYSNDWFRDWEELKDGPLG